MNYFLTKEKGITLIAMVITIIIFLIIIGISVVVKTPFSKSLSLIFPYFPTLS